ncbi:hypothetical protein GCM10027294_32510 [Marinactinospora endophytica]
MVSRRRGRRGTSGTIRVCISETTIPVKASTAMTVLGLEDGGLSARAVGAPEE